MSIKTINRQCPDRQLPKHAEYSLILPVQDKGHCRLSSFDYTASTWYPAHSQHLTFQSINMACKASMIPVCGFSDLTLVIQALREHCSLSGHDPSKAAKPSKQKQGLAPVQPAVPLELTVDPIPDQVEMERYCDVTAGLAWLE